MLPAPHWDGSEQKLEVQVVGAAEPGAHAYVIVRPLPPPLQPGAAAGEAGVPAPVASLFGRREAQRKAQQPSSPKTRASLDMAAPKFNRQEAVKAMPRTRMSLDTALAHAQKHGPIVHPVPLVSVEPLPTPSSTGAQPATLRLPAAGPALAQLSSLVRAVADAPAGRPQGGRRRPSALGSAMDFEANGTAAMEAVLGANETILEAPEGQEGEGSMLPGLEMELPGSARRPAKEFAAAAPHSKFTGEPRAGRPSALTRSCGALAGA